MKRAIVSWIAGIREDESGQTLVEYAFIIAIIGLGLIAALFFIQGGLETIFRDSGNEIGSRVG